MAKTCHKKEATALRRHRWALTVMNVLSKQELVEMLWGIANCDQRAIEWNTEAVSKGTLLCRKEEQSTIASIGKIFSKIAGLLAKDNTRRAINIASMVNANTVPEQLKGTEVEPLLVKVQELLNNVSNQSHS